LLTDELLNSRELRGYSHRMGIMSRGHRVKEGRDIVFTA
jgi:hypothetical protein